MMHGQKNIKLSDAKQVYHYKIQCTCCLPPPKLPLLSFYLRQQKILNTHPCEHSSGLE